MRKQNSDLGRFEHVDLGTTKPTARNFDRVEVQIELTHVLGNFAKAFVNEASRKNPLTFNKVKLTVEEVEQYILYLMRKRVESVNGTCTDFPRLKVLWIPSYVQYCLRLVGRVVIREEGFEMIPVIEGDPEITFNQALLISEKIAAFERDLQLVEDAMPRDPGGNVDVMSTALIAGYVCARREVHLAATYVCAFMGMKLQQEAAFQVLYRLQYDDLDYIAAALTTQRIL